MSMTPKNVAKRSTSASKPKTGTSASLIRTIDDTLSPQGKLFVELYFQFNFNAPMAYERAGYAARSARVHAYKKINQAHIQAAIAHRRDALPTQARASLNEKLSILESIMRDERNHPSRRIAAILAHSKLCGDDEGVGRVPNVGDEITPGALRALSLPQLIERVNNGTVFTKARVIDASL